MVNLAGVREDGQLQQLMAKVPEESCILFEDIDNIINGREVNKDIKFNFSTLLNVLDGLYAPTNVVFIMTTNKPECLDSAMLRKGRTDLNLEIPHPRNQDIEDYINNYYNTDIRLCNPEETSKIPMSEVQHLCLNNTQDKVLELI